uniref:Ribosomal protein S11 n=1 Tax=Paramoeba aparasomata TaxID=2583407 RepID=A0A5P8HBX9_9EUKA|nr:hypothetical protein [Paramoeba aparasomata]
MKRKFNNFFEKPLNIGRIIKVFNSKSELFKSIKYFNVIRKSRNIFINISNLRGSILKHYSCGMLHKKGSERRTFVAFQDLLEYVAPINIKKFKLSQYIIRIRTNNFYRAGFKRNLKEFLKTSQISVYKYVGIKFKAHNGVRKRKQKRK